MSRCELGSLKANVFSVCQGIVIPDNMIDNVLLYDVNVRLSGFSLELSNPVVLKDGWKNM